MKKLRDHPKERVRKTWKFTFNSKPAFQSPFWKTKKMVIYVCNISPPCFLLSLKFNIPWKGYSYWKASLDAWGDTPLENTPSQPLFSGSMLQPGRLTAGTCKSPIWKGKDLNQSSRELCSMLIFRGAPSLKHRPWTSPSFLVNTFKMVDCSIPPKIEWDLTNRPYTK